MAFTLCCILGCVGTLKGTPFPESRAGRKDGVEDAGAQRGSERGDEGVERRVVADDAENDRGRRPPNEKWSGEFRYY